MLPNVECTSRLLVNRSLRLPILQCLCRETIGRKLCGTLAANAATAGFRKMSGSHFICVRKSCCQGSVKLAVFLGFFTSALGAHLKLGPREAGSERRANTGKVKCPA